MVKTDCLSEVGTTVCYLKVSDVCSEFGIKKYFYLREASRRIPQTALESEKGKRTTGDYIDRVTKPLSGIFYSAGEPVRHKHTCRH